MKLNKISCLCVCAALLSACGGGASSSGSSIAPTLAAPSTPVISSLNNSASIIWKTPASIDSLDLYWQDSGHSPQFKTFVAPNIPESYIQENVPSNRKYWIVYTKNGLVSLPSGVAVNVAFTSQDLGYWGATSILDLHDNNCPTILGSQSNCDGGFHHLTEASLGLGNLHQLGRIYRDIRFADFDNDGYLDAVANVYNYFEESSSSYVQLYWGASDYKFHEDVKFSQKHYSGFGETVLVADFDNDGYLDIFLPSYTGFSPLEQNYLLKNNRNRTFSEVADSAGVADRNLSLDYRPEGVQAFDWNDDGLLDFYSASHLYINQGNWKFKDIRASLGLPLQFDEGFKVFDYDNDGQLDFLYMHPNFGPILYANKGGNFVKESSVFMPEYYKEAYGLNVADVNGDGYEDILVGGGYTASKDLANPRLFLYSNGKYVHNGFGGKFNGWSDLITVGDVNLDGAIDVFARIGNIVYFRNETYVPHSLHLNILDAKGHKNQFGRKVVVKPLNNSGFVMTRFVDGGSGYMSNSPYMVTIPLPEDTVYSVTVYYAGNRVSFDSNGGFYDVYADGKIKKNVALDKTTNNRRLYSTQLKLESLPQELNNKRHYSNPEADYFNSH